MKKSIIIILCCLCCLSYVFGGNTCGSATEITVVTGDNCTPDLFTAFTATASNMGSSCASNYSPDWYLKFQATNTEATIQFGSLVFGSGQLVVYEECGNEIYCQNTFAANSSHLLSNLNIGTYYQIRILFPAGLPAEGFVCVYSPDCIPQNWYFDGDNDSYGNPNDVVSDCNQPAGYVSNNLDCNDGDQDINPAAAEICNGIDDDCDDLIDDADPDIIDQTIWYADFDDDSYGDPNNFTTSCYQPDNYVENSLDCNDYNEEINPDETEICNGADDNCDGLIDDDDPSVLDQTEWFLDDDGDGFGDVSYSVFSCDQPEGYVDNLNDCDDTDSFIHPNAEEICNGIDDNCDDLIDDDDPEVTGQFLWYGDMDGDGFGDPEVTMYACLKPQGYVDNDLDCDDDSNLIYEDAPELCDNLDNDCDGEVDEENYLFLELLIVEQQIIASVNGYHPPFSYLWSTGETSDTIDIQAGEIWVIVTDSYDCTTSDTITISNTKKVSKELLKVYPVPSEGLIKLEYEDVFSNIDCIEIMDSYGNKILTLNEVHPEKRMEIDLSGLEYVSGSYIIRIIAEEKISIVPFILLKE